jgi:hypothetical protein
VRRKLVRCYQCPAGINTNLPHALAGSRSAPCLWTDFPLPSHTVVKGSLPTVAERVAVVCPDAATGVPGCVRARAFLCVRACACAS